MLDNIDPYRDDIYIDDQTKHLIPEYPDALEEPLYDWISKYRLEKMYNPETDVNEYFISSIEYHLKDIKWKPN